MEKLKADMSVMDMMFIMSECNPGAMMVIKELLKDPKGTLDVLLLDSMDIRGSHLYMLYNDCCNRSNAKFARTLMMMRCGVFTQDQVDENLSRVRAISFIDDSIMNGVPPYGEEFGPTHPKWKEWCEAQKASFERRTA